LENPGSFLLLLENTQKIEEEGDDENEDESRPALFKRALGQWMY
jgi:hypothetical protein